MTDCGGSPAIAKIASYLYYDSEIFRLSPMRMFESIKPCFQKSAIDQTKTTAFGLARARITQYRWVFCFLALALGTAAATHCAYGQLPDGFGPKPIFDEEFNQTSLDTRRWSFRGLGTRNDCEVDPSAISVGGGFARIRIYSTSTKDKLTNYCGAISTQSNFMHRYGYWEAAIRFKYQSGMQTSFWLQSPTIGKIIGNPQQSGVEMDVFEHIASESNPKGYDHALHWDGYQPGIHKSTAYKAAYETLDDGQFHIFGLAWTPNKLTFYIDGKESWTATGADAAISKIAEYLILDTELPHANYVPKEGYGPLGAAQNAYLDVDYVRVYPLLKH